MREGKGFSLIELLIVLTIIGILAVLAIPNLVSTKAAANEASAISSVRTITTAQITYFSTIGNGQFAADLVTLADLNLIDPALGGGVKNGFNFTTVGNGTDGFSVNADPSSTNTGRRHFYSDQTGVTRAALDGPADSSSDPLGQP